jgi:periplasmic copper chaperone A
MAAPVRIPLPVLRNIRQTYAVCPFLSKHDFTMRRPSFRSLCSALMLGIAATAPASQASAMFIVNQPWVRPAQVAHATEAYMDLTSTEGGKLVGVRSSVARTVAIRAPGKTAVTASGVTLLPGMLVSLAPGQYRIALVQLLRTLAPGDRVDLTLTVEDNNGSRQEIAVNAEVRMHSPIDDERRAHTHTHPPH